MTTAAVYDGKYVCFAGFFCFCFDFLTERYLNRVLFTEVAFLTNIGLNSRFHRRHLDDLRILLVKLAYSILRLLVRPTGQFCGQNEI